MINISELTIKRINNGIGRNFIIKYHYSKLEGTGVILYFGIFANRKLEGVISIGHPIRKKSAMRFYKNAGWNSIMELKRMVLKDTLPRNSESYCLAKVLKALKKIEHIKMIISFADAVRCGHGTIYQASNFDLIYIRKDDGTKINPVTGEIRQHIRAQSNKQAVEIGKKWVKLNKGFQILYGKVLRPRDLKHRNYTPLPYKAIKEAGASMYKGIPIKTN